MLDFFQILGIDEGADEEAVKAAYRKCLPAYNPEDDPKGFQKLRAAYEQALAYVQENAGRTEQTSGGSNFGRTEQTLGDGRDETAQQSPGYINDVAAVYHSYSARMSEEAWRKALSSEIYKDLDEGAQAKRELFLYLTNHWKFPANIYRVIDETVGISDCQEELREYLPGGFVDFCLDRMADETGDGDFPYEWLTGDDDADYDSFVDGLLQLMHLTVEEQWEEALACAKSIRRFGINHPYYETEQAKLLMHEGKVQEACALARTLIAQNKDSIKTRGTCAEILWAAGFHEEAFQTIQEIQEQFPGIYEAEQYLCYYYGEKDELFSALEHGLEVIKLLLQEECDVDVSQAEGSSIKTTEMGRYMDDLYRLLLERYYDRPAADVTVLHWVLRGLAQLGLSKEGLAYLDSNQETAGQLPEHYQYKSLFYRRLQQYDKALEAIYQYRERLQEEDGFKKAISYKMEAKTLEEKGCCSETPEQKRYFEEALSAIEKALALEAENIRYNWLKLKLLMQTGAYEAAMDTADQILQESPEQIAVLAEKQKACYKSGKAQEAVDLYDAGVKMAPDNPRFYEIAANVFLDYEQTEDADKVLAKAKEAGVTSAGLTCAYIRSIRKKQDDYEVLDEIRKLVSKQEKAYESVSKPTEEEKDTMAALYAELSYACYYAGYPFKNPVEDRINMQKAIALVPNAQYYFGYGRMLLADKEMDLAMEQFEKAKGICSPKSAWLYTAICECMGHVYECRRQGEDAINSYKEGLKCSPNHASIPGKIAYLYSQALHRYGSMYFAKEALIYELLQLERDKEGSRYRTLLQRCGNYLLMRCYDKALEDAQEILRIKTLDVDGLYCQGRAYLGLKRYAEALESFQDAAEMMEGGNMLLAVYRYAGKTLEMLSRYEEAEQWYKKGRDWNPNDQTFFCCLKALYMRLGEYDKAKNMLHRIEHNTHLHLQFAQLRVDMQQCNASAASEPEKEEQRQQILLQLKEAVLKAPEVIQKSLRVTNPITAWSEIGDMCLFYLGDYKRAEEMYLQARKAAGSKWAARQTDLCLMYLYHQSGDRQRVTKYGNEFLEALSEYYTFDPETEASPYEQFEQSLTDRTEKLSQLVMYWYCMGDSKRAAQYQEMLAEAVEDAQDLYEANQYNPLSELFIGREAEKDHDCRN